jgi:hypothetical protein
MSLQNGFLGFIVPAMAYKEGNKRQEGRPPFKMEEYAQRELIRIDQALLDIQSKEADARKCLETERLKDLVETRDQLLRTRAEMEKILKTPS